MSATTIDVRRELAHRRNDGIEVFLFWSPTADRVTVEVFDARRGEDFEFDVDGRDALDAFHHPYAYAAVRTVRGPIAAIGALAA
jgi:hypothetical protein